MRLDALAPSDTWGHLVAALQFVAAVLLLSWSSLARVAVFVYAVVAVVHTAMVFRNFLGGDASSWLILLIGPILSSLVIPVGSALLVLRVSPDHR